MLEFSIMKLLLVWLAIISVAFAVRYHAGSFSVGGCVFDILLVSASVTGAWLAKK